MPDDMPFDCWPTYRDEDGIVPALLKWWPKASVGDPRIVHALRQIEVAEAAIDQFMTEKGKQR